jgi:hypothetical protein
MRLSFQVQRDRVLNTIEDGPVGYQREVPFDRARISELIEAQMGVLERGNRAHTLSQANLRRMREIGERLTESLVHPEILRRLPAGDVSILLHLDAQLVAVPWELLHDGRDFWCHRYDLGRAVATAQAMGAPTVPMPQEPLRMLIICADARGDLPRVMQEGEMLLDRLDGSSLVSADLLGNPSVDDVKARLGEFDALHFAGHAEHDRQHSEKSGWLLRDGRLTAEQISAIGSSGKNLPFLVFSNACRSGQTDAWQGPPGVERIYGLANAFLLAGVRLYVGTQWEVVDGHSAELALEFYEALARGSGAGMAMRVARKRTARNLGIDAMAWASYVLYGDPALAPLSTNGFRSQKELLSASLLEARVDLPAKKPIGSQTRELEPYRKRPLTGPVAPNNSRARGAATLNERQPSQRKSPASLVKWLGVAAAVVGIGLGAAFALGAFKSSSAPPKPALEPAFERSARPTLLLLVKRDLKQCIERALEDSASFRVLGDAQPAITTAKKARALAREKNAELAAFVDPVSKRLCIVDALTGEIPLKTTVGSKDCKKAIERMRQVFLGEGRVLAVSDREIKVNLGWRSRVTPGGILMVLRNGKPVGSLKVTKVALDHCFAEGQARVGDQVRLPR